MGELRSPRAAALPVLAALGGMGAPIAIYLAIAARGGASGVTRRHIPAIGGLGGIGFTVSIFIADLSLETHGQLAAAKLAVLAASALAACLGLFLLRRATRIAP